jgi:hypothetical protein
VRRLPDLHGEVGATPARQAAAQGKGREMEREHPDLGNIDIGNMNDFLSPLALLLWESSRLITLLLEFRDLQLRDFFSAVHHIMVIFFPTSSASTPFSLADDQIREHPDLSGWSDCCREASGKSSSRSGRRGQRVGGALCR